jgi:putative ABC transport system permease protein
MKTPLALLNLVHHRVRTLVAVAGVSFAVVLIFMQLGFLGSLKSSATVVYDALEFDLCIRSKDYLHLSDARAFPRGRLTQVAALQGVEEALPFNICITRWRILAMGVRQGDPVFRVPEIQSKVDELLAVPEFCLIDRKTRPDYGPVNGERFGDEDIAAAVETEVGDRLVRVVGHFTLGAGFAADGSVLLNERGFTRASLGRPSGMVSLGLIQLESPVTAEQADRIAQEIASALPNDVDVLPRGKVIDAEVRRWVEDTSYGTIFKMGVAIAMLVGTAIVYQVLASDVAAMLPEYATLKAMGYRDRFLMGVVLQEAVILALFGFIPGLAASWFLYGATAKAANIPIELTNSNILLVLGLTLGMCLISGLGALRKLFGADPAELF